LAQLTNCRQAEQVRPELSDLFVVSLAIGTLFNNVSTGVDENSYGSQTLLINNFAIDLNKIVEDGAGRLNVEATLFPYKYPHSEGDNFDTYASSYLGGDQSPQHSADSVPVFSLLSYENQFLNNKLNIEFGKINLQRNFFMINSGLDLSATDPLVKWDSGVPDASTGSLGIHFSYALTPNWDIRAGYQDVLGYSSLVSNNGWDVLNRQDRNGGFYLGGVKYASDDSSKFPLSLELTSYYSDATYSDPYYSTKGTSVVLTDDTAKEYSSDYGFVAKLNKKIAGGERGLYFFSSLEHSYSSAKPISWGSSTGLYITNPTDLGSENISFSQLTFKVHYIKINESTLLYQRDLRVSNGGDAVMTSSDEFRYEVSAAFKIKDKLIIQPVIEYIQNPDTSKSSSASTVPDDGWVVGVVAMLPLGI
jgi:carbohydrate-selective porin OprB